MPKTIHLSAIIAAFLLSFTMVHLALDEAQAAPPIKPEKCDNGRDDDQDGLIDLDDPDCQGGGGSAPSISEVMVDYVSDPNNIAIFGADFDQGDNLTVTLGDEGALTVTEALAGMITAQLPAGVVGGPGQYNPASAGFFFAPTPQRTEGGQYPQNSNSKRVGRVTGCDRKVT